MFFYKHFVNGIFKKKKYCGVKIYFKTDLLYNICDLIYLMDYDHD